MKSFRKLKVKRTFRPRRFKSIVIPEIRLQGKWLERLGFTQGKKIQIEEKFNKLVITIETEKI